MRPGISLFALLTLCAYRLTYLIVDDQIFDAPRDWVTRKSAWLGTLISCVYCTSIWTTGALVAIVNFTLIPLPLPALWWGSSAAAISIIAQKLDD